MRDLTDGTERQIGGLVAPNGDPPWAPLLTDLAWHPDGDRIAFSFSFGFEREESQIWVLEVDSDRALADALPLPGNLTAPVWTGDGRLFAVERYAEAIGRVPVVRFDDLDAQPAPDERFSGMPVFDVVVGASSDQVVGRMWEHGDVYVFGSGAEPRLVATDALAVAW